MDYKTRVWSRSQIFGQDRDPKRLELNHVTHLISALDHVIGKLVGIQLDSGKHENLNAHKCNKQMKTVLINLET